VERVKNHQSEIEALNKTHQEAIEILEAEKSALIEQKNELNKQYIELYL